VPAKKAAKQAGKKSAKSSKRTKKPARPGKPAKPVKAAKADGAAPVKAYIAKLPAWQGKFLARFDELVSAEAPDAVRAVKWSACFYGQPGGGWFASSKGFSKHVKVTWFSGTKLRPVPPAGESETGRAIDLRETDTMDERQIRDWIRQARSLPGWGNT
jgi:hypothetical protein